MQAVIYLNSLGIILLFQGQLAFNIRDFGVVWLELFKFSNTLPGLFQIRVRYCIQRHHPPRHWMVWRKFQTFEQLLAQTCLILVPGIGAGQQM